MMSDYRSPESKYYQDIVSSVIIICSLNPNIVETEEGLFESSRIEVFHWR